MAGVIVALVLIGLIAGAVWVMVAIARAVFAPTEPGPRRSTATTSDEMDEGYFRSGPYGYTPGVGYPESQYGSGFDPDAEWHEREG